MSAIPTTIMFRLLQIFSLLIALILLLPSDQTAAVLLKKYSWKGHRTDAPQPAKSNLVIRSVVDKSVRIPSGSLPPGEFSLIKVNDFPILSLKAAAPLIGAPLAYPNPMPFTQGTGVISYRLSDHMDVDLRIHNMVGMTVYQTTYFARSTGGSLGYNEVPISASQTGYSLPAGLYVFILMYNKGVIGKGKFVVVP